MERNLECQDNQDGEVRMSGCLDVWASGEEKGPDARTAATVPSTGFDKAPSSWLQDPAAPAPAPLSLLAWWRRPGWLVRSGRVGRRDCVGDAFVYKLAIYG